MPMTSKRLCGPLELLFILIIQYVCINYIQFLYIMILRTEMIRIPLTHEIETDLSRNEQVVFKNRYKYTKSLEQAWREYFIRFGKPSLRETAEDAYK